MSDKFLFYTYRVSWITRDSLSLVCSKKLYDSINFRNYFPIIDQIPLWKIFLKFEPNRTTFYYIQKSCYLSLFTEWLTLTHFRFATFLTRNPFFYKKCRQIDFFFQNGDRVKSWYQNAQSVSYLPPTLVVVFQYMIFWECQQHLLTRRECYSTDKYLEANYCLCSVMISQGP